MVIQIVFEIVNDCNLLMYYKRIFLLNRVLIMFVKIYFKKNLDYKIIVFLLEGNNWVNFFFIYLRINIIVNKLDMNKD